MLSRFLVGLLSPDADEFLKYVAHLHVGDANWRKIQRCEPLDDLKQQVALVHMRDLVNEPETFDDLLDVLREIPNVSVEILCQKVGCRSPR